MADLNPNGIFADELKALAVLEHSINGYVEDIDAEIAEIEAQLEPLREQREQLLAQVEEKRNEIEERAEELFLNAQSEEERRAIRKSVHHLVSYTVRKDIEYDAAAARQYVIDNQMWDFINKPNLSKTAMKKAFNQGKLDWIEAEHVEKVSVKINKLGELLITMGVE